MMKRSAFTKKKQTLTCKLFGYMFLLALLLALLLMAGLLLTGRFVGTNKRLFQTLDFQSKIFSRQLASQYNSLAVLGIQLSENSSTIMDCYLEENSLSFHKLNGSEEHIAGIQQALFNSLYYKLLEAHCTGAFILLDAQINTTSDSAAPSKAGLYLQRGSLDATDTRVLLYRGLPQLGKSYGCMPHRKWRLEFRPDLFPGYDELVKNASASVPLAEAYRITDVTVLPGTSERAMLMVFPLHGSDGSFYGLCGFEISASYFKSVFAQPSELDRAVFCLSKGSDGLAHSNDCFSAGILNRYYLAPSGAFHAAPLGKSLIYYKGDNGTSYVGVTSDINLCPNQMPFSISVLIPGQDYLQMVLIDITQILLLALLFIATAAGCCLYFGRRYLIPIKRAIAQIQQREYADSATSIEEIDDLFGFLSEKDQHYEQALNALTAEKQNAEQEMERLQAEYDKTRQVYQSAQAEIARLAYSRKQEIDPDQYQQFLAGIQTLTPAERKIFNHYLEGKSVREIMELLSIKESTLRYHNQNIYGKLGINSLKQLLRYAAVMHTQDKNR